MSLPRLSVRRPVAVAMLTLAAVFLGLISFVRLPIDLLPSIAYPRLVIYTRYPDVGPTEVERFVTEQIEQAVGRVPGVERVESVSREGMSLVTLRFSWGTDMDFAALNVREQLDNIRDNLPELAVRPAVLRTDPNADPIMAVSASGGDLAAMKDLAESVFKRRLEQIDGIAEAALTGGLEREIHVEVNPRLLETFNITVDQVAQALDAANQNAPGGTIRRGRYRYALRTLGEFQTVEEIGQVPVGRRSGSGGQVLLRDVAKVEDGFKDRESIARYNGQEAVGLLLFKEAGANTVRVTQQVNRVLDQLRAQYPEVQLAVATAQAGFITDAISNVVQTLVYGGILAFLVLFLFLHDPRYPVAISLAIPISVVATFALLDLTGVSLNIMSLGGLALGVGMLVDNSIVVLENIFRHREMGVPPKEAAAIGAEEVQTAVTASTLTTIAVFAPIVYVKGVAGELFGDLSIAVASALMASLVVALTLLPTMAARWGAAPEGRPSLLVRLVRPVFAAVGRVGRAATQPLFTAFDRQFDRFAEWYHRMLEGALERRGAVMGGALAALVAGIALATTLDRAVLPNVEQGEFTVRVTLPRGTPLEETEAAAARIENAARTDPDVETVFTRVGREAAVAGVEDEETGLNTADVDVRLRESASTPTVVARLRGRLGAGFAPDALTIETGSATALGRLLGGEDADLVVRIRGDDLDQMRPYAAAAIERLQRVAALTNVHLRSEEGQPEVRIEIARDRAAAFGIEPRRIAQMVEQYMRGDVATQYVDFDEKVPIVVRLPDTERRSLETLRTLKIDGIPLRELVNTREETGPGEVRRRDQGRVVEIYADARGGLDDAVSATQVALADVPPPRGVRYEIGGANEERARSFRDLAFAFGLALLLVYMILAAQFESFVHPFTILLAVPLATVGASLTLFATGSGLNTMSLIGAVILVGIVVNDAIVKVEFINQLRAQGMALREAILEAGRKRLRPIIMTTVTTVLGLLPMALGFGRGADLRQPLALVVIGGLTSATVLTLIVVPVAYSLIESLRPAREAT